MHTIPSALMHFGTVYQTRVLNLSILAWRVGQGPLNQTQYFYGRKIEGKVLRKVEHAESKTFYSDYTKRGSSCLKARH
jgi:hypothetical protein